MRRIILFSLLMILCFPAASFAHSGKTDADGGHHDYDNISGLGSYHYHHGYSAHLHTDGVCPYDYDELKNKSSYTPSVNYSEYSDITSNKTVSNTNSLDNNEEDGPLEIFFLFVVAALGTCYALWIVFTILSLIPFLDVLEKPAKWFGSACGYIAIGITFIPLYIIGIIILIPSKIYSMLFPKNEEQHEKPTEKQSNEPEEPETKSSINNLNFKEVKIDPSFPKSKKEHISPDWLIPEGYVIGKNNLPADVDAPRHWGKTFTVYLNPKEHIYHKGSCKYVNPYSCHPEHIIMVFRDNTPCDICNPKIPDVKWYFDYLDEERKINKIK